MFLSDPRENLVEKSCMFAGQRSASEWFFFSKNTFLLLSESFFNHFALHRLMCMEVWKTSEGLAKRCPIKSILRIMESLKAK